MLATSQAALFMMTSENELIFDIHPIRIKFTQLVWQKYPSKLKLMTNR